jgi:8-oxo-dGTP diphosphatase
VIERQAGHVRRVAVVAAVIEQNDAFLVTCRPDGVHLAGLWEFPGGKIDAGETHQEALKREILEELGTGVDVHDLVFQTTHDYPERSVALYFYRCTLTGMPSAQLGQRMQWVPRKDLRTLGFPPADEELIRELVAHGVVGRL